MQAIDYFKPAGDSFEIEVLNKKDGSLQSSWKDDNMSVTNYFASPGEEIQYFTTYFADVYDTSRQLSIQVERPVKS